MLRASNPCFLTPVVCDRHLLTVTPSTLYWQPLSDAQLVAFRCCASAHYDVGRSCGTDSSEQAECRHRLEDAGAEARRRRELSAAPHLRRGAVVSAPGLGGPASLLSHTDAVTRAGPTLRDASRRESFHSADGFI